MYRCTDCKSKFEYPEIVCESLEMKEPPYRRLIRCPFCKSGEIEKEEVYHCQNCGVRLPDKGKYCSAACRQTGERLYAEQMKRRGEFLASPVALAVKEVEEYNKTHGTRYSYGEYFMRKYKGELK